MTEPWKACRKGSCQRHQACMYMHCTFGTPPQVTQGEPVPTSDDELSVILRAFDLPINTMRKSMLWADAVKVLERVIANHTNSANDAPTPPASGELDDLCERLKDRRRADQTYMNAADRSEAAAAIRSLQVREAALVEGLKRIDGQVSHAMMGDWSIALARLRHIARALIAEPIEQREVGK